MYFIFTVPLQYSEDETLADITYCTPYCDTPCLQQPKQLWKEGPPLLIICLQYLFIILRTKQGYKEYIEDLIARLK